MSKRCRCLFPGRFDLEVHQRLHRLAQQQPRQNQTHCSNSVSHGSYRRIQGKVRRSFQNRNECAHANVSKCYWRGVLAVSAFAQNMANDGTCCLSDRCTGAKNLSHTGLSEKFVVLFWNDATTHNRDIRAIEFGQFLNK